MSILARSVFEVLKGEGLTDNVTESCPAGQIESYKLSGVFSIKTGMYIRFGMLGMLACSACAVLEYLWGPLAERMVDVMLAEKRVLLAAVFLAGMVLSVRPALANEAVRLELKHREGDSNQYIVRMDGKSVCQTEDRKDYFSMFFEMLLSWTVLKSSGDGTLDVKVTVEKGTHTIRGRPTKCPYVGHSATMTINRRGELLQLDSKDAVIDYMKMPVTFPDRPLAPGESWTATISYKPDFATPVAATYTFTGYETINGYHCAVISSDIHLEPTEGSGEIGLAMEARGTMYFAVEEGLMVRNMIDSTFTVELCVDPMEFTQPAELLSTITMAMAMELLDKKDK